MAKKSKIRNQVKYKDYVEEKQNIFTDISRLSSFKGLKDTINRYGYDYSFKEFVGQAAFVIIGSTFIAWFSQLRGIYLGAIIGISILAVPFIISAWFAQKHQSQRFEMLQAYLSNILPIFMQKPKVLFALREVLDLTSGDMEKAISRAIEYIETDTEDESVLENGLKIIEREFPNARVKAVHKLLLSVEGGNSEDYHAICENMYLDIEAWIRRVYNFQSDLKDRRFKLLILCVFSLALNSVFIYMYSSNEIFDGFTDMTGYQISTFLFIFFILLTALLVVVKLHGAWLIDDAGMKDEEQLKKDYEAAHTLTGKPKPAHFVMLGLMLLAAAYFLFFDKEHATYSILCVGLGFVFFTQPSRTLNMKKNKIKKTLMLEFPIWLRDVALNLNNLTVINAIEQSKIIASYPMQCEIDKFLQRYEEEPNSIKPYNEFLSEYNLEDVQSTMKVLYTIQSMGQKEIKDQISLLINRNQELLNKTEAVANEDSLGGVEALGYAPMILVSLQMMISMALLFSHVMNYLNSMLDTLDFSAE